MIPEIDAINRMTDPNAQYQWLLHYFIKNTINVVNIHLCRISGDIINPLAVHLHQYGLRDIAIIKYLYRLAMTRGSAWAKYHLAEILSRSGMPEEISEASCLYSDLYHSRSVFSEQQFILDKIYYYKAMEAYQHQQLGSHYLENMVYFH